MLSIIPVVFLFVVYVTLTPSANGGSRFIKPLDIKAAIRPLSSRIAVVLAVVLGMETIILGFSPGNILLMLILGLAKALFWYYILQTVCSISPPALLEHIFMK